MRLTETWLLHCKEDFALSKILPLPLKNHGPDVLPEMKLNAVDNAIGLMPPLSETNWRIHLKMSADQLNNSTPRLKS
jgi:hypothetical protein